MPKTKTPSDEKMIETLARKMGWKRYYPESHTGDDPPGKGYFLLYTSHPSGKSWAYIGDNLVTTWSPLESLDQVYGVEERLTDEEQDEYIAELLRASNGKRELWMVRHADARTCSTALARVIDPELFEEKP